MRVSNQLVELSGFVLVETQEITAAALRALGVAADERGLVLSRTYTAPNGRHFTVVAPADQRVPASDIRGLAAVLRSVEGVVEAWAASKQADA